MNRNGQIPNSLSTSDKDESSSHYNLPVSSSNNPLPTIIHNEAKIVPPKLAQTGNPITAFESVSVGAEVPEIAALLMAQRARTPIAIAVAQDYTSVPFRVPRPFIVLGWFWVTDAWVRVCRLSELLF